MSATQLSLPPLSSLKPFRSFLFLKASTGNAESRTAYIRNLLAGLAEALSEASVPVRSNRSKAGEVYSAYAVYRRQRRAAWTTHADFVDIEHHLVVVSGYKNLFAVFMSDGSLREAVKAEMRKASDAFKNIEHIPTNKLNAVFVKGRTRTLWLNNVQGQTSLKADNKVLSGIDLEDTLDPLADQSYAFTAARCQNSVAGQNSTYGIAPGKSRLWFKPAKNWSEYTSTVTTLLQALDLSTEEVAAPLPVLSVPVSGQFELQQLGEAYGLSLRPAEVTNPAEEAELDLAQVEATPDFGFEVLDGAIPNLRVSVLSDTGANLGEYRFELKSDQTAKVTWNVQPLASGTTETATLLNSVSDRISASFDGAFSVSAGRIHSAQYRDLPFAGFVWTGFGQTDIRKEKPAPLSPTTIGMQDSLFCRIKSEWATDGLGWLPGGGWLASNDGALEVADFIHLSDGPQATLTLIHVKASTSNAANRMLAAPPFEVVVSQAVKNLRHADPFLAADEFTNRLGRQIQNAVWRQGIPARREDMLAAIVAQGANLRRRVVVVQPHARRRAFEDALQAPTNSRARYVCRQLSTLLLSAQQGCAAVGAEFSVVAHDA